MTARKSASHLRGYTEWPRTLACCLLRFALAAIWPYKRSMSHSRAEVAPDGYDPQALRLPDGRDLAYCLYGREDGTPVLFFYGTPGTMFLAPDRLVPVDEMGIRLLVADEYALAESDRAVLKAQARSPGHLFRTRAAYTGGIDGCVDDVIAFTRPWKFDVADIRVPVSIWYGPDDVLCPRSH
jgi:hypothetical protein